jgi:hypothetical protein
VVSGIQLYGAPSPYEERLKVKPYRWQWTSNVTPASTFEASMTGFDNPREFLEYLSGFVRAAYFSEDTIFEDSHFLRALPVNTQIDSFRFERAGRVYITSGRRYLAAYTATFLELERRGVLSFPTSVTQAREFARNGLLTVDDELLLNRYWLDMAPQIIGLSADLIKLFYDVNVQQAESIDQELELTPGILDVGLEITSNNTVAQTFTVGLGGTLSRIEVPIQGHRCQPVENLVFRLVETVSGFPTGMQLASAVFPPSVVEGHINFVPVFPIYAEPVTLSVDLTPADIRVAPGDHLAIVLSSNAASSGCTYAWVGSLEVYPDGTTFVIDSNGNIGGTPGAGAGLGFRTFVTTGP